MRLLIDAGNTRLKWQLRHDRTVVSQGAGGLEAGVFSALAGRGPDVSSIAISTVISESGRQELVGFLASHFPVEPRFYWSEPARGGMANAYAIPETMGADRWHAMYGAWKRTTGGFAVVDAGSAVTVDYVSGEGRHLGGYILPGRGMMLRSLKNDAARIGFEDHQTDAGEPGMSTTECVHHGRFWLWQSMVDRIHQDCLQNDLRNLLVTGGDAGGLLAAGLRADRVDDLVLAGLDEIDTEERGSP